MTVLVSTHYMDEAERCHDISYIAYGDLLAQGTVETIVASVGLTTWRVTGGDLTDLAQRLQSDPAVDMVVSRSGGAAYVASRDAAALERIAADQFRKPRLDARRNDARGRLHPSDERRPGAANERRRLEPAFRRCSSELLQLRRDRLTFATMIFIPVLQLLLFGYAINNDPRTFRRHCSLQDGDSRSRAPCNRR